MSDSLENYDILASSTLSDRETQILKHDELFGVFDGRGDFRYRGLRGVSGLYYEDTRHLSRLEWKIAGHRPLGLSDNVGKDNTLLTADMTNPDMQIESRRLRADQLHVRRETFLVDRAAFVRIEIANYSETTVAVPVGWEFDADFADVFEVRGADRNVRPEVTGTVDGDDAVVFSCEGVNGPRRTRLKFAPAPDVLTERAATTHIEISPHQSVSLYLCVECSSDPDEAMRCHVAGFDDKRRQLAHRRRDHLRDSCRVSSTNTAFNSWLDRSYSDLAMLATDTADGLYPYAGTPWFSTVFGRDGLITAMQYLWIDPNLARGVLSVLAANQAEEVIPEQDAEPGKILHEVRRGEMALTGEVPFRRYYGSIDSTPLFIWLAAEYFERTGDIAFIRSIWPNIQRGLEWIDEFGDRDGDGYVEYGRQASDGLVHQGWKDSNDAVFHADGSDAIGPIALCEVQAYVFGAFLGAGTLAQVLGEAEESTRLLARAKDLRDRFNEDFWDEELGTFVLALDGEKRPCRVRTSNAAQCLAPRIADPAHVATLVRTLADSKFSCGWGIRTLAEGESRFNPMSYHNGSVWPHDCAMIALGLSRYGYAEDAARVASELFDAATSFDLQRLPELYCGFERAPGREPTRYPVACAPQAWAAGTVFMLLRACLGLELDAVRGRVTLDEPMLPAPINELILDNLSLGEARLSLIVRRHPEDIAVEVIRREGTVEVVIVK